MLTPSFPAPLESSRSFTDRVLCVQSLLYQSLIAYLDDELPLLSFHHTKMKRAAQVLPLAALAATVSAQTTTIVGDDPNVEGTTTITYSICPTAATLTTTLSSTLTLCPGQNCNGGSPDITMAPGQGGIYEGGYTTVGPNGESTVYETFYPATCSTGGMADVTYMITEACPCEATRASDYLPSGFETTVATLTSSACDECEAETTTITLTTPCATGPYATAGITNTGGAPAATGAAVGGSPAAGGSGAVATGSAGGNSGSGGGAPGAGESSVAAGGAPANTTGGAGSNSTVSPPITPVGGNMASDVGPSIATMSTSAAQKVDVVGFVASAAFAVFVGAAAWWL